MLTQICISLNSGFGSATATTTTIINTGGGTTGLMTSSSAGALTANHNTNQVLNALVHNEENKTCNLLRTIAVIRN